jgi:hypothetical protein
MDHSIAHDEQLLRCSEKHGGDRQAVSYALFSPKRPDKEEGWNFKKSSIRAWPARLIPF